MSGAPGLGAFAGWLGRILPGPGANVAVAVALCEAVAAGEADDLADTPFSGLGTIMMRVAALAGAPEEMFDEMAEEIGPDLLPILVPIAQGDMQLDMAKALIPARYLREAEPAPEAKAPPPAAPHRGDDKPIPPASPPGGASDVLRSLLAEAGIDPRIPLRRQTDAAPPTAPPAPRTPPAASATSPSPVHARHAVRPEVVEEEVVSAEDIRQNPHAAADKVHRVLVDVLRELEAAPGDLEGLLRYQRLLQVLARPVRRMGFKTFGTLVAAMDQTIALQLHSPADPPEELLGQMREVASVVDAILGGRQSRIKAYYELIAALEETRVRIGEAAGSARERRRAEWRAREDEARREARTPAHGQGRPQLGELLEIFLQEMGEHLDEMTRCLLAAEQEPANREVIFSLMRSAHSIKGSAAITKQAAPTALAHSMEDLMVAVRDNGLAMTPLLVDQMLRGVDALAAMRATIETGGVPDPSEHAALKDRFSSLAAHVAANLDLYRGPASEADAHTRETLGIEDGAAAADASAPVKEEAKFVNVDIRQLDALMNLAADLVINRTRLSSQLEQVVHALGALSETRRQLGVLSGRLRREVEARRGEGAPAAHTAPMPVTGSMLGDFTAGEFDRFGELDLLARDIRESLASLDDSSEQLSRLSHDIDQQIGVVSSITNGLHESIMRTRMIPIGQVFNRFPRAMRDLARTLGKQIELRISGADTPLDKNIIEEIADPLMHLLRNAADHGLEDPADRAAAGKPITGTIRMGARQAGNLVVIEVADDGRGIDLDRVREKAVERGLMTTTEALAADDHDLHALLMTPGFSTAREITDVSGRGVGLDVVAASLQALKGSLTLKSVRGRGTTFTLRLPMSLSIAQALLFHVGSELYAMPLGSIEEIVSLSEVPLYRIGQSNVIHLRDALLPLTDLRALLATPPPPEGTAPQRHIIVIGDGANRAGVVVDRLVGREEIVVKGLGGHLRRVEYVSGGTVLGDGRVVLILDAVQLITASEQTRQLIADVTSEEAGDVMAAGMELVSRADREALLRQEEVSSRQEGAGDVPAAPADVAPASPVPASLVPATSLVSRSHEPHAAADAPARRRVLVVDDSVSIRRYVSGLLEAAGYEVTMAQDGIDALDKLAGSARDFALILTDLEMPRMHGYELIAEIRADLRHRATPIVVLTGRMGEKHSRKALELGASAFLVKPFEEQALLATIGGILAGGSDP